MSAGMGKSFLVLFFKKELLPSFEVRGGLPRRSRKGRRDGCSAR
jgi:hypothetical protein